MHLTTALVWKRPALLHRLTGLTCEEFTRLVEQFTERYQAMVIQPRAEQARRQRAYGGGRRGEIPEASDKLLFILSYTRIYPLLFIQGMLFGMEESPACRWVKILLPVLDATLGKMHLRPKHARGRDAEEFLQEFPELREWGILVDGVERPVRRPKDAERQTECYSGKKKRHTTKQVTLAHPKTQYILAVSAEHPGKDHDKKLIDEEGMRANQSVIFKGDSGFQGLAIGDAQIITPIKKKRKKKGEPRDELSPEAKQSNRQLAQERIAIEHSNAGFKRNHSASDILRNTRKGCGLLFNLVAMSLHNLRVTMRASYQLA